MNESVEHKHAVELEHDALVARSCKPGEQIIAEITPERASLLHMGVGVSGEAAELLEGIVEYMNCRDANFAEAKQVARVNIIEEMGDIEFFMKVIRNITGIRRDHVVQLANGCEPWSNMDDITSIAVALVIAAGKLLDQIKKHCVYCKELDRNSVASHLSWIEHSLGAIRICVNTTRPRVLQYNLNKLNKRYGTGAYSNEAAQRRADKITGRDGEQYSAVVTGENAVSVRTFCAGTRGINHSHNGSFCLECGAELVSDPDKGWTHPNNTGI